MLSHHDIINKDYIEIEPFDQTNLHGATYDLTLGKRSYSLIKKKLSNHSEKEPLRIAPLETVIFETKEKIKLKKNIAATIHSNVTNCASKGISNVSTTIDPGWEGTLAIQIHNHTKDSIVFNQGKEPICSLCFYKLKELSDIEVKRHENREDIWTRLDSKDTMKNIFNKIKELNEHGVFGLIVSIAALLSLFLSLYNFFK